MATTSKRIPESYKLGRGYEQMPIPPVAERCLDIPAGPVIFMIESRDLGEDSDIFDAYGGTVHVLDAEDRTEYLRFDCFDEIPHYHYVRPNEPINLIVRIDEHAEGDPLEWALGRLEQRLPEMLDFADATDLAAAVRADRSTVDAALGEVSTMLREAASRADDHRASGASLTAS